MQSRITHGNCHAGRTKVKSGCRTCKIRKVKCDEGYPACSRCVSTGRVCDGYGIWGGGGNFYGRPQHPTASRDGTIVPRPASVSFFVATMEEKECFDWFKCRTVTKLPGSFISPFWTTLILQASLSEPAVLHAVLALSSVHRGGILHGNRAEQGNSVPDKLEQFTLQHYVKAISRLQPHFSAKDRASFRVALIACIVFVSLDFLRGHFLTAQIHLQNGLKLLKETQLLSERNDGILIPSPCSELIDDWIVEALSRLHAQVELFKPLYQHSFLLPQASSPTSPAPIFCTFKEAWHEMDRLLNQIFHLTKQAREQKPEHPSLPPAPTLLRAQKRIQRDLTHWLTTYKASKTPLLGHSSLEEQKAYLILSIYHTMLTIMTSTALHPLDESTYDTQTPAFTHLITRLASLWSLSATQYPTPPASHHLRNMSGTITDLGWIPPLYYAALKCRIHRIRLQAIRLLESTSHREGIWDARIAACVARRVVEVEEGGFYAGVDTRDGFLLESFPESADLGLGLVPVEDRLRDVEVGLVGEPVERVVVVCGRREGGVDCRVCVGEYHVSSQRWVDVDRFYQMKK